ncbi:MAG: hypothetical protein GX418_12465 [Clostridiales bacterium]|nr:hypothetical protein [Clostridiales bacterium]
MNTLVVYTSKTGFTKQYAEEIAARLGCEAMPAGSVPVERLAKADVVVYGGWVFAGKVNGLAKARPLVRGKLIVFAVGATRAPEMDLDALRTANALEKEPLFYLEGGFRFDRLGMLMRFMIKTLGRMAAKKENPTEQDRMMAGMNGANFDYYDAQAVAPLVAAAQAL